MYYVGADLHKEKTWFYVTNSKKERLFSKSIPNDSDVLNDFFSSIPQPFTVAVESTYNWYFFVDIAESYAEDTILVNPIELKSFSKKHKKTDKIDAKLIAEVLMSGYIPSVTIPPREIREVRELIHYRTNAVKERSRGIHRLKGILAKLGDNIPRNFTTLKSLNNINTDAFSQEYKDVISGYITTIKFFFEKINEANKLLRKRIKNDEEIRLLMTIPGIGFFSAALIKCEIIDINRFKKFNNLCAYAGLASRTSQSGNKTIRGPLNINRRKMLRWILIETVMHFIKSQPRWQKQYQFIKKRKHANTAKVALARQMLKVIFHVLKEKRGFYYA